MEDRSKDNWCNSNKSKVDTEASQGAKLMATGSCPVHGKYIAFTDKSGNLTVDHKTRWMNEIRGKILPFAGKRYCSSFSTPAEYAHGMAEIPKSQEGFTMYALFTGECPVDQNVQDVNGWGSRVR